jgi:5-methylcytosine-specific restriction endonuclease McrA
MNYAAYLSSAAWRTNEARLRELAASGFACRLCPNSAADGHILEVHHRTYERLGAEIDGDLITLCRECHLGVTSMLRARRYALLPSGGTYISELKRPPPEPLFDPTPHQEMYFER